VSVPSPNAAVELCVLGMSQIARFRADAMQSIDAAIAADSGYCLPLAVKACMTQGANDARFNDEVEELINAAQQRLPSEKGLEVELLTSVQAAHAGRGVEAATVLEQLVMQSPTDLFLHVLAQEQIFWLGEPQWMLDVTEKAAPAWTETHKDYGPFLSVRAFACEEAGLFDEAERFGRAAVEIDASDVWGAHAVAHVMLMRGENRYGVDWLENLSQHWGEANQMRHHLWWHICLGLLELGEYDRIFALLDTEIRNLNSPLVQQSPSATIDINNYSSLLMRLELYGIDVADHWPTLAGLCAERVSNHGSAFSNVHDMMVLTGAGLGQKSEELLRSMKQQFSSPSDTGSTALSYKVAGIPVCEAILAHRAGDFVFYHLLVHAAEQEKRGDLRALFLRDIERLGFTDVLHRAAYKQKTH